MDIGGLQKLTLLDFPGHVAAIVFTNGCNFRCPYCHNSPLVIKPCEHISSTEVLSFLEKRAGILDGVSISGGEPLMQPGLTDFIKRVRSFGLAVKIDTNGSFPDRLEDLINGGLADYVAMDIKNSVEKYPATVGNMPVDMENIRRSVKIITESGVDYEFRTTVARELHTPNDTESIGQWISGAKRYFLQAYKRTDSVISDTLTAPDEEEMKLLARAAAPFVKEIGIR